LRASESLLSQLVLLSAVGSSVVNRRSELLQKRTQIDGEVAKALAQSSQSALLLNWQG
jgi:hypothetical protein